MYESKPQRSADEAEALQRQTKADLKERDKYHRYRTLSELRGMSEEEVERAYDALMRGGGNMTPKDYLFELERRYAKRQHDDMRRLTQAVFLFTAMATIATVVSAVFVVMGD